MTSGELSIKYDEFVKAGQINNDAAQRDVLVVLQRLKDQLEAPAKPAASTLGRLFKKQPEIAPARGVYMWGGVGRGKSMLMDLFYENIAIENKRRVHFHAFMQEVHARIHQLRNDGQRGKSGADPVIILAQQIIAETSVLCFDELQATDVADATLLYRLFSELFAGGVIIVSTSNQPPASLYTGGVQRERFAKFIELIESNMQVVSLNSQLDYRHLQMKGLRKIYHYPLGASAEKFVAEVVAQLCKNPAPKHASITVLGRKLPFSLYDDFIGKFKFSDLCENALGPADYLAIAKRLETMILTDIPKLPPEKRNEAKRFVTLIDALYENKVKLIATAEVPPEEIYGFGDGSFEFKRTASRLAEMQSEKWIGSE